MARPGDITQLVSLVGPGSAADPWRTAAVEPERERVTLRVAGVEVPAERLTDRMPLWRLDVGRLLQHAYGDFYAERCHFVAKEYGRPRRLNGRSSTSRGPEFGDRDVHTVVLSAGSEVQEHLPWLTALYRGPLLQLANALVGPVTGGRYVTSADPVSAVNLNLITPGERYEWHVDSNPLTGLLFCPVGIESSKLVFCSPPDAGRFAWVHEVTAGWGHLLLFDARNAPHCVRNVTGERVTVPMNFHIAGGEPERPPDLDRYLYG
jgi:hypothetical protein